MLDACADGPVASEFTRVLAFPPSTSTLVVLVHLLTAHFVLCKDLQKTTMHRLAIRSLLERYEEALQCYEQALRTQEKARET